MTRNYYASEGIRNNTLLGILLALRERVMRRSEIFETVSVSSRGYPRVQSRRTFAYTTTGEIPIDGKYARMIEQIEPRGWNVRYSHPRERGAAWCNGWIGASGRSITVDAGVYGACNPIPGRITSLSEAGSQFVGWKLSPSRCTLPIPFLVGVVGPILVPDDAQMDF